MDQPGPAGSVRVRRWVVPPVAPRHLSQCQRKHRFPDNNKDFGLTRLCDLHSHGSRTDGDLVLSVISPPWPTSLTSASCGALWSRSLPLAIAPRSVNQPGGASCNNASE